MERNEISNGQGAMNRTRMSVTDSLRGVALLLCFACALTGVSLSQAVGPSPSSQATSLPLSGRPQGNGSVTSTQTAIPGTTTSVNTLNPAIQVQGPYAGSANSTASVPFSGKLSLSGAIDRGLRYNLGSVGLTQAVRQSQGQSRVARSALLPNLNSGLSEVVVQDDLAALGLRSGILAPGLKIPTVVGPFNYFDLRARLSQTVADLTAWNSYRAVSETVHANQLYSKDARDLVVLAVGGAYLQVIAAKARVQSAQSQLETANALLDQTSQRRAVGLIAQIDVNRSQVQALTLQQRLLSLKNDLAKQKINLARLVGLPPTDTFELSDEIGFAPLPPMTLEEALQQAADLRADLKAARAEVRAAEHGKAAARDERLPALSIRGDYGVIGTNPSQSHGTFSATASLTIPLWQGGRVEGDIEEADAALVQRRAEAEDTVSHVESDVRNAWLDLEAARTQIGLAEKNRAVTRESLELTKQRYEAGVSDNLEVVQAQDAVASADLDYINSIFAHNVAKLSLARAMGVAADRYGDFLKAK